MKTLITIIFASLIISCQAQWVRPRETTLVNSSVTVNYADLYIIAGQSNVGRARVAEMTAPQQTDYSGLRANTYIFNPNVSTAAFNQMNVGTNTMLVDPAAADEFGPEASLFKLLQDYNSKDRYVLKYGDGGTALNDFWRADLTGLGYDNLMTYLQTCIDLIIAQGKTPRLVAFIWMQGENDAVTQVAAEAYLNNLIQFFVQFRTDYRAIVQTENYPYYGDFTTVIGKIGDNNGAIEVYKATVRQAQEDYILLSYKDALINTDGYLPLRDNVHYSATGQITFGTDIFNIVKDL